MIPIGELTLLLSLFVVSVLGIQYEIYREEKTWDEARDTCSRDNKRLVHVTEHLQHIRIKNYSPFIFDHFWIGLKQADKSYKWTDDSVARFTAWGQGQPNSQTDCVRYSASDFTWETHNCSSMLYFMCENEVAAPKASGSETRGKGLLIGFGAMLGLLLFGILLLQLPCCRSNTVKAIGHFGLGRH
ncbi:snaclec CHH-B subunit beta-like [Littorina saxatilis]|uniref:C-type lectin domain-containing protein n=1 Tax=Littorina saxatilis TaxID=31220 RepID=A0AAN9AW90_9CAEN